jgi:hypothetical protein
MRLQAAIEYLTTYGWALIIIALAVAVVFSLISSSPPQQQCILPAGLSCSSFFIATNGMLSVVLQQVTQTPINITSLACNTNPVFANAQQPYNPPSNQVPIQIGGSSQLNVQCWTSAAKFSGSVGTTFYGYLFVNYTDQFTGFPHTVYGKVAVTVS